MKFTIVFPVFNEESVLPELVKQVNKVVNDLTDQVNDCSIFLLFVNDGSTDGSMQILDSLAESDKKVMVVHLATNAGHQSAVWCGLENAPTDSSVIVMDCDLQDPPELVKEMIEKSRDYEIVMTRRKSRVDGKLKKITAFLYYRVLKILADGNVIENSGDFYLLSRKAVNALLTHRERVKYLRGLIANLGFRSTTIEFARNARFAGKTHYGFGKMLRLALAGVTGFSIKPLLLISYVAAFVGLLSVVAAIATLIFRLKNPDLFSAGFATSVLVSLALGFFVLLSQAIVGLYLSRVLLEVKNRPLYHVLYRRNFQDDN